MRLRLIWIILLALLTACSPQKSSTRTPSDTTGVQAVSSDTASETSASKEQKECTVYVTRTGKRYHQGWCRSLSQSKIPMTRTEAIQRGYTPCKLCGGSECEH
jgi:hypothetical protein